MKLENKTYDILKFIALRVLPALATLVIALGQIWSFENASLIAGTITAVNTFLGTILGISSKNYWEETSKADTLDPKEEGVD